MKAIVAVSLIATIFVLRTNGEVAESAVGYKPKLKAQADIEASYVKLAPLVAAIDSDSKFALYEGLPHQTWHRDQLESELQTKQTITRFDFPFYKVPNEVSVEDVKKLSELIQSPKSFMEFEGYKGCGGFHPDFSLVWKDGEEAVEIHICFGCCEIKAFRKNVEVYCDIQNAAYEELESLLGKYQQQRPKPHR